MLACSGARSFALSLLEGRGGLGVDGNTPTSCLAMTYFGHSYLVQSFLGLVGQTQSY